MRFVHAALASLPALCLGAYALQGGAATAQDQREPLRVAAPEGAERMRCGVIDLTPEEALRVERDADALFSQIGAGARVDEVVIPVAWHVISKGESEADGNVPDDQIAEQLTVLNDSYAPMGIRFETASVDRTVNRNWYGMRPGTPAERQAKKALVIDATQNFNVYLASPGGGLLGWATFPWNLRTQPEMDGVVILNESMPGGRLNNYNEGDTLVHEAGHWLGLYHTFQGGCANPGDHVDDTAPEGTSTSGCPANKDTCTGGGPDPIENFMDYSYDPCMFEFTAGQNDRVYDMSGLYRRDLFGG